MMTWWLMGSTTSCNGSCFQWAIPAPEGSNAMRNGAVPSTRAISASAARRSETGMPFGCALGATGGALTGSCSGSRLIVSNRQVDLDLGIGRTCQAFAQRLGGTHSAAGTDSVRDEAEAH